MLQNEFEGLTGLKVTEEQFEVINAMYMLDNNETKQDFCKRYMKMGRTELIDEMVKVNAQSKKYTNGLLARVKELETEMLHIAVQAQEGHLASVREGVRKVMGRFKVIRHLWQRNVPLNEEDINTLMFMAEKGGAE